MGSHGGSAAVSCRPFCWSRRRRLLRVRDPKRFLTGPLTIEDQGSFFIGGVPKVTNHATPPPPPGAPAAPGAPAGPLPHQITIGQMYVQFQIPARKYAGGWPVIMVHGSSHTGACLESTPDGREGWYPYFVRKGVPSYVVDQAGRGRSGFDESVIHEGEADIVAGDVKRGTDLIPGFGRITDDGAWTAWFGHLMPANSTILTGTLIRHGDAGDPNPNPDAYKHVEPLFPLDSRGRRRGVAGRSHRTGAGRAHRQLCARVRTSSWYRTPRSPSRARPAPRASLRISRPPIPGRRTTWRRSSSGSAAPSSSPTRSRGSWGTT